MNFRQVRDNIEPLRLPEPADPRCRYAIDLAGVLDQIFAELGEHPSRLAINRAKARFFDAVFDAKADAASGHVGGNGKPDHPCINQEADRYGFRLRRLERTLYVPMSSADDQDEFEGKKGKAEDQDRSWMEDIARVLNP